MDRPEISAPTVLIHNEIEWDRSLKSKNRDAQPPAALVEQAKRGRCKFDDIGELGPDDRIVIRANDKYGFTCGPEGRATPRASHGHSRAREGARSGGGRARVTPGSWL